MEILKIKETCLYVHDLEQVKDFYQVTLALPLISYVKDKHLFFQAGSSVLLIFNPADSGRKDSPPAHDGGGRQHFAFEVAAEEYEDCKREIKKKDIKIIDEVTWKSGKKSFYFHDPAGNVLEIVPDRGIWD